MTQRDLLFAGPYIGCELLSNGGFVALRRGDAEIIVVTNFICELKAEQGK